VLDDIINRDGSYYRFAKRKSEEHRDYFMRRELNEHINQKMEFVADQSLQQQYELEASQDMSLDTFLERYFNNTL